MRSARKPRVNARLSCNQHRKRRSQRPNWKKNLACEEEVIPFVRKRFRPACVDCRHCTRCQNFISIVCEFAPISGEQSLCEVICV